MILANVEFLHDMQGMPLDDIMNNHETESTADVDAFVLNGNGSSLRARRDGDSDLLTKKTPSEPEMGPWGFLVWTSRRRNTDRRRFGAK